MAFDEVRLPSRYSRGAVGGMGFSTQVVETAGGFEQRNERWAEPKGQWQIGHLIRTPEQVQELIAFFHARRGRARGFRFKDWNEYAATNQSLGVGDGTATEFQLRRVYPDPVNPAVKPIRKPVAGTVAAYVDGAAPVNGFSVDSTTGVITFTDPPADGAVITADFEHDWPVRFDVDVQQVTFESIAARSWPNIPLVEDRSQ